MNKIKTSLVSESIYQLTFDVSWSTYAHPRSRCLCSVCAVAAGPQRALAGIELHALGGLLGDVMSSQ